VGTTGEPALKLTLAQRAEAEALYRHLLSLKEQGIKLVLAHLEDEIGVHAVGRRANIAKLIEPA